MASGIKARRMIAKSAARRPRVPGTLSRCVTDAALDEGRDRLERVFPIGAELAGRAAD